MRIGENRIIHRKTSRSKEENQQQTQPTHVKLSLSLPPSYHHYHHHHHYHHRRRRRRRRCHRQPHHHVIVRRFNCTRHLKDFPPRSREQRLQLEAWFDEIQ